jgi:hypothetical protein
LKGFVDIHAKRIAPALHKVEQRKKMDPISSTQWCREREKAVRNAIKKYTTFSEDADFLCLLFAHKFQALSTVLLQIVL